MAPKSASAKTAKVAPAHPKYSAMIATAIAELKERTGSSRQAISKFIQDKYKVSGDAATRQLNLALKKGVASGVFVHPKGHGGSYRLAAKPKAEKKPKKASAKKTVKKAAAAAPKEAKTAAPAKPAKKAAAKKPAAPKKTAKKAAAKKAAAKKTSAKKPAAKKAKASKKE